jgi:hypothetical protein
MSPTITTEVPPTITTEVPPTTTTLAEELTTSSPPSDDKSNKSETDDGVDEVERLQISRSAQISSAVMTFVIHALRSWL